MKDYIILQLGKERSAVKEVYMDTGESEILLVTNEHLNNLAEQGVPVYSYMLSQ